MERRHRKKDMRYPAAFGAALWKTDKFSALVESVDIPETAYFSQLTETLQEIRFIDLAKVKLVEVEGEVNYLHVGFKNPRVEPVKIILRREEKDRVHDRTIPLSVPDAIGDPDGFSRKIKIEFLEIVSGLGDEEKLMSSTLLHKLQEE